MFLEAELCGEIIKETVPRISTVVYPSSLMNCTDEVINLLSDEESEED